MPRGVDICLAIRRRTALLYFVVAAILCILCLGRIADRETRYRSSPQVQDKFLHRVEEQQKESNFIFYTVKTSKKFHRSRLEVILQTWIRKVKGDKVIFVSDGDDADYAEKTGHRMISTNCNNSHSRPDLCCKLDMEFTVLTKTKTPKWWCHFDDDTYVNVPNLKKLLRKYDWKKPWYIGRRSVDHDMRGWVDGKKTLYNFTHGGSGFCLTSVLANKLKPWMGEGKLMQNCEKMQVTDDCAVGLFITNLLNVTITGSTLFHSHREQLNALPEKTLDRQISISYKNKNRIKLDKKIARFDEKEDPTRFLSLHCLLYPKDELCF